MRHDEGRSHGFIDGFHQNLRRFIVIRDGFGNNNAGQKTVRGNKFTVNSLRNILVNRAYIGEYKFGKTLIPDGMPRLIDDETFQKAQAKLEANKRGGKGAIKKLHPEIEIEDYCFSAIIIRRAGSLIKSSRV